MRDGRGGRSTRGWPRWRTPRRWPGRSPRRGRSCGRIGAPVLVLVGADTFPFMAAAADSLVAALPHAEHATVAGSGHRCGRRPRRPARGLPPRPGQLAPGCPPLELMPGIAPARKASTKSLWSSWARPGVGVREGRRAPRRTPRLRPAEHRHDRLLGLERHQRVVAVGVPDAVQLRRRPAELREAPAGSRRARRGPPSRGRARRARARRRRTPVPPDVGVAQELRGVRLQRPPAHRRPVPLVLEVPGDLRVVDDPFRRGDVALLDREDDVVLQRLVVALQQHVVGGQPGAADAEAAGADQGPSRRRRPPRRHGRGGSVALYRSSAASTSSRSASSSRRLRGESAKRRSYVLHDRHPLQQAQPGAGGGGGGSGRAPRPRCCRPRGRSRGRRPSG